MQKLPTSKLVASSSRISPNKNPILSKLIDQHSTGISTDRDRQPDIFSNKGGNIFGYTEPFLGLSGSDDYIWTLTQPLSLFENPTLTYIVETDATAAVGDHILRKKTPWEEIIFYADNNEFFRLQRDIHGVVYAISNTGNKRMLINSGVYDDFTVVTAGKQYLKAHLRIPTPDDLGFDSKTSLFMMKNVNQLRISVSWGTDWCTMTNPTATFKVQYSQLTLTERYYSPKAMATIFAPLRGGGHMLSYYYGLPSVKTNFTTDANGEFTDLSLNFAAVNNEVVLALFVYCAPVNGDFWDMVEFNTDGSRDSIRLEYNNQQVWTRDRIGMIKNYYRQMVGDTVPSFSEPPIGANTTPAAISITSGLTKDANGMVPIVFSNAPIQKIQDSPGRLFPTNSNAILRFTKVQDLAANTAYTMNAIVIAKRSYKFLN